MDNGHFEVIVLGTGITESITAAYVIFSYFTQTQLIFCSALAKAGYSVAHIDSNALYGGNEASLSANDLEQWTASHASSSDSKYTSITTTGSIPSPSRDYSLSIAPSVLPSRGKLIDTLIASGVARYGAFKLLTHTSVYSRAKSGFQTVPGSKEEIFKSKALSLLDKRRLMRFLVFAGGEFEEKEEFKGCESMAFVPFLESVFSLPNELATTIAYALALNQSATG